MRIPDLGDAQDVEVIEICVQEGQLVEQDDVLIVLESDKASMEIPSQVDGTVKRLCVAVGDLIETDDLIVEIELADDEVVDGTRESEPTSSEQPTHDDSAVGQAAQFDAGMSSADVQEGVDGESTVRFEIRLPELDDINHQEVIEVLAAAGDHIDADQPLVVLKSDSGETEVPSRVAGKIESIEVSVGDMVAGASTIAIVSTGSSAIQTADAKPENLPDVSAVDDAASLNVATHPPEPTSGRSIYAGPAVRRLARELGVKLEQVNGSGVKGRIVKDDVKLFVKSTLSERRPPESSGAGIPEVSYPDFAKFGEIEEVPLTRIEGRGAANLVRSWLNVVHVTEHDEADVTELEEFRDDLNERADSASKRLTILPFVLKACASTLQDHPRFNASIGPALDRLILKKYINIGMAVDTPDGLVVPVVHDVLDKGLRELDEEITNLSLAAREKSLKPNQVSGATFTVSSLGRLGGTGFTPIVNAPELAILGVARLTTKPVWNGEEFVPRKILPLSLSYDHRAINGADGGRFMLALVEKLSDVRLLIL